MENELTFLNWLLAFAPILIVLVLMIVFRWGGAKAGPAGWFAALMIGWTVFRGDAYLLAYSQLDGVLLSLYVLYIIWLALVLYLVVDRAGAIQVIGRGILRLTADRLLQLLILAWVFSAFLQGVAGFGVPIAVVAPLLIGLGFNPVMAVAGTAIGHSWSVTFGDIASSFNALMAASGLSGYELAPWAGLLLGVACLACGIAVTNIFGKWQALRHGAAALLIIGGSMAATQYLLAVNGLWNLAGFVAGMVGLVAAALVTRLPLYRRNVDKTEVSAVDMPLPAKSMPLWTALLPYLALIVIVSLAELWEPLHHFLNSVQVSMSIPEMGTGLGWITPAHQGRNISIFGHPGALLAYTSVFAFIFYWIKGYLKPQDIPHILGGTVRSAVPSSIGIVSMVGMALIMERCGMTYVLAKGLSNAVGSVFPLVSPFIGMLGAFMTGSNTNSNVVFTPLQKSTAELLRVSVLLILAAQTTGGSLGSMLAPAKIIVGCSTTGLSGKEGDVMRITVPYGIAIALVIGLLVWLGINL